MIVSPQLTAGARSPMRLVAPSKNLSPCLQCSYSNSNSNPNHRHPTRINMLFNQKTLTFTRLSLYSTPLSPSRDIKSRLSSFPVSQDNLKNNIGDNKSRFPALALANSYYDDESQKRGEEVEKKFTTSSSLQNQEKARGNLVTGLALGVQIISAHVGVTICFYMLFLTVIMTSPVERWILEGLKACSIISACLATERYAFVTQEHQECINGPSKSSPRFEGQTHMTNFYDGVIWGFVGTCLAIVVLGSSIYSLKISDEFGYIETIIKSFSPVSLVVSFELWPLQASICHLLSNLLGLTSSLCCYDQRDSIQPQEVARHLGYFGTCVLLYIAMRNVPVGIICEKFRVCGFLS